MPQPGDLVRVVTWRLDAGQPVDAERLTTAARRAYNAHDLRPRRAARHGGTSGGRRRRGRPRPRRDGDARSAATTRRPPCLLEQLAGRGEHRPGTGRRRRLVGDHPRAVPRARARRARRRRRRRSRACRRSGPGRPAAARRWRSCSTQAPKPAAAIEAARPLLDRPVERELPPRRLRRVAGAGALRCARRGDRGRPARPRGPHGHRRGTLRFLPEAQFIGPMLGAVRRRSGRRSRAELASEGYDAAVAARRRRPAGRLRPARRARRRPSRTARRRAASHFREAAAVNREINDVAGLRWALGGIALAAGMGGDRRRVRGRRRRARSPAPSRRSSCSSSTSSSAAAPGRRAARGGRSQATGDAAVGRARARRRRRPASSTEALLRHDLARLGERRVAAWTASVTWPSGSTVNWSPALGEPLQTPSSSGAGQVARDRRRPLRRARRRPRSPPKRRSTPPRRIGARGLRRRAAECARLARRLLVACEGARSPAMRARPRARGADGARAGGGSARGRRADQPRDRRRPCTSRRAPSRTTSSASTTSSAFPVATSSTPPCGAETGRARAT